MSNQSALEAHEPLTLVSPLRQGLAISHFFDLIHTLGVPEARLAGIAGIAVRTLARRKEEGRFHTDESERLWRLERVLEQATSLFGEAARDWLLRPCPALQDEVPLELCDTEAGARQIELVLWRLGEGIPQ